MCNSSLSFVFRSERERERNEVPTEERKEEERKKEKRLEKKLTCEVLFSEQQQQKNRSIRFRLVEVSSPRAPPSFFARRGDLTIRSARQPRRCFCVPSEREISRCSRPGPTAGTEKDYGNKLDGDDKERRRRGPFFLLLLPSSSSPRRRRGRRPRRGLRRPRGRGRHPSSRE